MTDEEARAYMEQLDDYEEKLLPLECCICGKPLYEWEAENTVLGEAHAICAWRNWQYDSGIPKE
jgi:hypothetical protein